MQKGPQLLDYYFIVLALTDSCLQIFIDSVRIKLFNFSCSSEIEETFLLTQVLIVGDGAWMHMLALFLWDLRLVTSLNVGVKDVLFVVFKPSL